MLTSVESQPGTTRRDFLKFLGRGIAIGCVLPATSLLSSFEPKASLSAETEPKIFKEFLVFDRENHPVEDAFIAGKNGEFVVLKKLVKEKDGFHRKLSFQNLRTGKQTKITTDGDSFNGNAFGKYFVYDKGVNARMKEIHLYDLEKEEDLLIDEGAGENNIRIHPSISEFNGEPIVVWTSYKDNNEPAVYGFTPSRGKFLISPAVKNNASNINPVISGNIIAWNKGAGIVFNEFEFKDGDKPGEKIFVLKEIKEASEPGVNLVNPSISPNGDKVSYRGVTPIGGFTNDRLLVGFRTPLSQKEIDNKVPSIKGPAIISGDDLFFSDNRVEKEGSPKIPHIYLTNVITDTKSHKLTHGLGETLRGVFPNPNYSNDNFNVYLILWNDIKEGAPNNFVHAAYVSVPINVN
ncbi:MAG: hypothetical protein Q7K55_06915 [Candidatus Levybacteria bacterium]|nr:hypothetical protein [Candidatus Levybacteria bacterium]